MTRGELMSKLGRVDWWRAAHRVAVFCRELRGDEPATITAETQRELDRARQLRESAERFASTITGGGRRD